MPPGFCECALCTSSLAEINNSSSNVAAEEKGAAAAGTPARRVRRIMGGPGGVGGGLGGEVVADKAAFESRYEFKKTLGDGGQGGVYLFLRRADGASVAVKEFGCLTAKEWRILSSVRHPHICGLVDRTRYENPRVRCTKLVMEIMDTSLQAYMMRGAKRDKLDPALDTFDVETARELILPVALALDYLHHKLVVHLDVKLDNIMLKLAPPEAGPGPQGRTRAILRDPESGRLAVKLADFGLAMLLGGDPCEEHTFYTSSGSYSAYCLAAAGSGKGKGNGLRKNNNNNGGGDNGGKGATAAAGGGQEEEKEEEQLRLRPSLVGDDSPPTSPGGSRERRFPAVGTNRYMAPEVEFDSRFGVTADIFSLGVVLHVLLTGRFPHTGLNQPARIDAGIPDVDGLRGLLEAMLHGDPYQRPHSFEVLDHPFLRPLRRPNDTLLGDLDDEAEQGGRVMLLQIRRGVQGGGGSGSAPHPPVTNGGTTSSSSSSGSVAAAGAGVPPPVPPQLLAVQSEERPLEVYVNYMDLAEIDDDHSSVVVCGRKEGMKRVKKGEASTLGAILVRERAGSATELGEILDVETGADSGIEGNAAAMDVDGDEDEDEGKDGEEGWPSVQRLVRKSGEPFGYVRSLWAALTPDRAPLEKEAIWAIYQELRRLGPQLAAEAGTALYLPMTGCNDRVEGFSSARAQRHAVIQESISLAAHLAEAIPSRRLESVVIYTWQKDAMHALMDFVRAHRAEHHGIMFARLDDRSYRAYVATLQSAAAAADPALFGGTGGAGWLVGMLKEMEALDTYPGVCLACHAVAARLAGGGGPLAGVDGARAKARGALEVLAYNKEKVEWEARERAKPPQAGAGGGGPAVGWVEMVGCYDTMRSLHALLSLLRALEPPSPSSS